MGRAWPVVAVLVAAALSALILTGLGAVVSPLARDLIDVLTDRYGAWGPGLFLVVLIGGLLIAHIYVQRREARLEYERTGTITVEKPKRASLGVKVWLTLWGAFMLMALGVNAFMGFH